MNALDVRLLKRHGRSRQLHPEELVVDAAFSAPSGVTVIVGPSGAGKTTILRCIAGLSDPDEGRIAVGGEVLFDSARGHRLPPARRGVAFVFQDLALFPHLSVADNVMYGLRRLEPAERRRRMREVLESFEIGHLVKRYPREISGGEQQRVALARSLVTEPSVLLLDEPLSSLDPVTKVRIIEDLQRWNRTHGIPILYVTHDHGEVLALGDRVIALERGRIVTEGLPLDVVSAPPRAALAPAAGFENFFDATVSAVREAEGTVVCQLHGTSLALETRCARPAEVGSEVCLAFRARDVAVFTTPPAVVSEGNLIEGVLRRLSSDGEALVSCGAEIRVRVPKSAGLRVAAPVWLLLGPHACHPVRPDLLEGLRRLFVFVCQGNTLRSPVAQAIFNAELAARFRVPVESLERLGIRAVSAGLTARPGEPLAEGAETALRAAGLPVPEHRARNLTQRLVAGAEAIFCMTGDQRDAVSARFPEAREKALRLNPEGDVADPHEGGPESFLDCVLQIQALVRQRLGTLDLCPL